MKQTSQEKLLAPEVLAKLHKDYPRHLATGIRDVEFLPGFFMIMFNNGETLYLTDSYAQ